MENLLDCSYSALITGILLSSNPLKMINIAIVLCKEIQRQYEVQSRSAGLWRCWRWWWGWEWMTCWKWPRLEDKGISWWSDPMIWGFLFYEIPLSTLFGCWLLCLSVTIHLAPHGINAFSLLDKMFNIYCIGVLMQNMNLSHLNIPLIDSKIFKKWRWVKGHQQFLSFH